MDRARAAGRGLPAGAQIDRGSGAGGALRAAGISLLLARRARLLGGGAAHPARRICRRAGVSPSRFRRRNPYRDGAARRSLFVSVYVPNGGKDFPAKMEFLRQMEAFIGEAHAGGMRIVLCGDINIARSERDVHPKERNPTVVGQRPEEREIFERLLARGLVDVGRALDPDNDNLFTWWAPWRKLRERNIGWRIDYILASEPLAVKAARCAAYREVGTSDHAPVIAEFDLNEEARK